MKGMFKPGTIAASIGGNRPSDGDGYHGIGNGRRLPSDGKLPRSKMAL